MNTEKILITWLAILTLIVLVQPIFIIINLFFKNYLNKEKLKNLNRKVEDEEGITSEQMETFEKYLELNLIDTFKKLVDNLISEMSEENKAHLIDDCCNYLNLEALIYLKEKYNLNIHTSKYDIEGKHDSWFNQRMIYSLNEENICEMAQYFIENGSDPKRNNSHLLYKAVQYNKLDLVKILVKYGADVTACERAAILIAHKKGYKEIEDYLLNIEKNQNKNKLENSLDINYNYAQPKI